MGTDSGLTMVKSLGSITLALDTSSPFISICLARDGKVIADWESEVPTQSSELLFERVQSLLEQANICPASIGEIVLGAGPGSFTGLRIGLAFALGIAYGNNLKLLMYPSHQAWSVTRISGATLCLSDARRGEFFISAWDGSRELVQPHIGSLQRLEALYSEHAAAGQLTLLSSDAHVSLGCALERPSKIAQGLVKLASAGVVSLPAAQAPLYLREVAAKTIAERAASVN